MEANGDIVLPLAVEVEVQGVKFKEVTLEASRAALAFDDIPIGQFGEMTGGQMRSVLRNLTRAHPNVINNQPITWVLNSAGSNLEYFLGYQEGLTASE